MDTGISDGTNGSDQGAETRHTQNWLRIESSAVAAILLFTFLVGPYGRWKTNAVVNFLHTAATSTAGSLFTLVLGTLISYIKQNQLYLVWIVFLGVAYETAVAAKAYSIYDPSSDRIDFEIGVLTNNVYVAVLMGLASFERFLAPLWALWVFTIAKMLYRVLAFRAAARTYGPENVDLVAYFMANPKEGKENGAEKSSEYNYAVRGEDKVTYKYNESIEPANEKHAGKMVNIDRVWSCQGRLLKDDEEEKRYIATKLKDVCLSFALFKLLRRRFRDYPAEDEDQRNKAKSLIREKLMKQDDRRYCRRTFRVVRVELEFLHDLFYTKYPISFYRGVSVLNILQLFVIASSVWTATWVLQGYDSGKSTSEDGDPTWYKKNIDRVLTYIFIILVIAMELWELSSHLLSNWSKVLTTCNYVRHHDSRDRFHIDKLVAILGWCGTLWKPLTTNMGQYSLFEAYRSHSINNKLYNVFTFFMGESEVGTGAAQSSPAKVTEDVQYAIFRALRVDEDLCISNGERSLRRNGVYEGLLSKKACDEQSFERKILVWHVATSYFELKKAAAQGRRSTNVDSTKKKKKKINNDEEGWQQAAYSHSQVAICLSRYCAYLLLFAPDLLPVNSLVAKLTFENVISAAREFFDENGNCCDMLIMMMMSNKLGRKEMYYKMKDVVPPAAVPEENDQMPKSIMTEGVGVAKELMESITSQMGFDLQRGSERDQEELVVQERIWKVLAEFWAEFLLYLAPSYNAQAHGDYLSKGGEFITHLWVLLYNAGIIERPGESPV